jgi:AraC family transcriptional activator of pobA
MDNSIANLYFFSMGSARRSRQSPHLPDHQVPAYFLYGERLQAPDERVIHVETIAARSALHDWTIRPHRHRDLHQVILSSRGSVAARLDSQRSTLTAPLALVIPPGVVHSFSFQPDTAGLVVSFAPSLARDLSAASQGLLAFLERAAALTLDRAAAQATDLWILGDLLLREFARSAPGRHTALRGLLGALLANALRLTSETGAEAAQEDRVSRELVASFRRLAERQFRHHTSVVKYAADLCTSEGRLRRACLAITGQTPIELLHLRLLVEAERQLRYTSMPVTQVAYHLGFEDPAYFSRFFSRRMGLSPRAFRVRDGLQTEDEARR